MPARHVPPQHPLERESATTEHDQVVVARLGHESAQRVRRNVEHAQFAGARREEIGEEFGVTIAQEVAKPSEEGVRVAHLHGALAPPALEGLVGRIRLRLRVALEERHPPASVGEQQRGGEPGDARAHHDRMAGRRPLRAVPDVLVVCRHRRSSEPPVSLEGCLGKASRRPTRPDRIRPAGRTRRVGRRDGDPAVRVAGGVLLWRRRSGHGVSSLVSGAVLG